MSVCTDALSLRVKKKVTRVQLTGKKKVHAGAVSDILRGVQIKANIVALTSLVVSRDLILNVR